MNEPLLEIRDLRVCFGVSPAVDGLSLTVGRGETVGLVGESGCGKSITALTVLGLLPPGARIEAGAVEFEGRSLLDLDPAERRRLRGGEIALVSQDPLAALNPVYPVGAQVAEAVRCHRRVGRAEAWETAVAALAEAGLPDPTRRARDYPHQLSGGQRQRVMIAMALVCRPKLLIADEPTTALDVSVQAQILETLRRLRAEHAMSLLLITHDLGVIAETADRVVVMRAGRKVEEADVDTLFAAPATSYTRELLAAVPRLDTAWLTGDAP